MGKLLVKIGMLLQKWWSKVQCSWNWLLSKLMFSVSNCPYKLCKCADKK